MSEKETYNTDMRDEEFLVGDTAVLGNRGSKPETTDTTPNLYLRRHLETGNMAEADARKKARSFSPEFRYEKGKEGKARLESGDFNITFDYIPLEKSGATDEQLDALKKKADPSEVFKLTSILIEKRGVKDKFGQPRMIRLENLLPPGYSVFFSPVKAGGFANNEYGFCFVGGNFMNPDGILTLLHEIGHCQDYQSHKYEYESAHEYDTTHEILNCESPFDEKLLARVLTEERNAWASALRVIRPFMDRGPYMPKKRLFGKPQHFFSLNKDLVLDHIHGYCLSSYSQSIRTVIEIELLIDAIPMLESSQG